MTRVKLIILDVLKPHHPSILEFANAIAGQGADYQVDIRVDAVDEKTETVIIEITGSDVRLEAVEEVIATLGGSIHSIDQVRVVGNGA
jgi:uncharacterized protein